MEGSGSTGTPAPLPAPPPPPPARSSPDPSQPRRCARTVEAAQAVSKALVGCRGEVLEQVLLVVRPLPALVATAARLVAPAAAQDRLAVAVVPAAAGRHGRPGVTSCQAASGGVAGSGGIAGSGGTAGSGGSGGGAPGALVRVAQDLVRVLDLLEPLLRLRAVLVLVCALRKAGECRAGDDESRAGGRGGGRGGGGKGTHAPRHGRAPSRSTMPAAPSPGCHRSASSL